MTKLFDIFSESRNIKSQYHGTAEGESFRSACIRRFYNDPLFDPWALTYDGCKLYDNEQEAKKG